MKTRQFLNFTAVAAISAALLLVQFPSVLPGRTAAAAGCPQSASRGASEFHPPTLAQVFPSETNQAGGEEKCVA
jgi:hypothetical protein